MRGPPSAGRAAVHEAGPDKHGLVAGSGGLTEMIRSGDAARRNPCFVVSGLMEPLCKTEAGGAIHLQRIQIPGVHLNDPCPGLAGKGEIGFIEDLNHGVDAVRFRLLAQGAKQGRVGRQADDEQQGRGRGCRRSRHL